MKMKWISALLALLILPVPVSAAPGLEVKRVAGANRYETAAMIAKESYAQAQTVVIASSEKPVDAMTGGVLAAAAKGPLLLVSRDRIDPATLKAIISYQPKQIYVLGGTQTISAEVEVALRFHGKVKRLAGATRYETAQAVELEAIRLGAQRDQAVYVSGEKLADSLVAGPLIAKKKGVMRLYNGKSIAHEMTVIGGTGSVAKYEGQNRIAGKNRTETAVEVAKKGFGQSKAAILVSDQSPTDALAAISLSQKHDAPIFYVSNGTLSTSVRRQLVDMGVQSVVIVGGSQSIDRFTEASARNLYERTNELGRVMILMYHQIDRSGRDYTHTPEEFYQDLEDLYKAGYLPVLLSDYVKGHMDLPAGYKPYIITFDDGMASNFRYNADGTIDKESGVGVIMEFAKTHPLFRPHATFFIAEPVPFRTKEDVDNKLAFLYANGMEIGNHSYSHAHFYPLDAEGLQYEIGRQYKELNEYKSVPKKVDMLCLPFGEWPQQKYMEYLYAGSYDGVPYESEAVIYVRQQLSRSPFHTRFDRFYITRMGIGKPYERTGQDLVDYFNEHPDEKFVSDGDPNTIGIPANWQDVLGTVPKGKTVELYPDLP